MLTPLSAVTVPHATVYEVDVRHTLVTEGRRAGRTPSGRITLLSFTARPHGRNQRGARQLLEKIYATCGEVGERDFICPRPDGLESGGLRRLCDADRRHGVAARSHVDGEKAELHHAYPPDASMRSPVSQPDWSEARNATVRAMSSGRPGRPSAVRATICFAPSLAASNPMASEPSVRT